MSYTDGSSYSNPGLSGVGVYIKTKLGKDIIKLSVSIGINTYTYW